MKGKLLASVAIFLALLVIYFMIGLFESADEGRYYSVVVNYLDSLARAEKREELMSRRESEAFSGINWEDTTTKLGYILPKERYRVISTGKKIFVISVDGRWLLFNKSKPYFKIINMDDKEKLSVLESSLFKE